MNGFLILVIIELVLGILINIFIGQLSKVIFRKDDRMTRTIFRIIGVFCIIDSILKIFHYLR